MKNHKNKSNYLNCLRIFTILVIFSVFYSCSEDEKHPINPNQLKYGVSFQVKGLSEDLVTRSSALTESSINNLLVVAFEENADNTKTFYKTFSPEEKEGSFTFDMLKKGKFQLYFVANTENQLSTSINGVKTPTELENIITDQAYKSEKGLFLMNSGDHYINVITKIGEIVTPSTSTVIIKRLVSCFEFHNNIEGFIPSLITFKNRVSKSFFINRENKVDENITNSIIKTEDVQITSTETQFCTLYSYENLFTEKDNKISFIIQGKLNGKEVSKEIILQNTVTPEDFVVKRNHKYKISLKPEDIEIEVEDIHYKLNFNLEVVEWIDEIINN